MKPFFVLAALAVLTAAPAAQGMASHYGWPPRRPGTLMMNKDNSDRPLDARPGRDPFGGTDPSYSCDTRHRMSFSCAGSFVSDAYRGYVMTSKRRYNRLYGGHGNDTITGGPWGDVLWGDYQSTGNRGKQFDRLTGGGGPDFIYTNHHRNVVKAGKGTDIIHARFGFGRIDCGPGRDAVYLPVRRNRYTYRNCEWMRVRTGESAPRWVLRKLPWPLRNN